MQNVQIRLSLKPTGLFLLSVVTVIAIISLTLQYVRFHGPYTLPSSLVRMFDLDVENNFPTWFSSVTLGACAILLFIIARAKRARREVHAGHFYGLAALFLVLSCDEMAGIHEAAQRPVERMLGREGLWVGWVLPSMLAVALLTILYLRFFLQQKRRFQILFAFSAVLYVGGAIGFEIVSWAYHPPGDQPDWRYVVLNLIEEVLEMVGVVVFLHSLMLYIADQELSVCFTVESG